jgi:GT2 family glycosyltransferase
MSTPAPLPDVSVAVINYNGEQTLARTLTSVFGLKHVRLREVMVFDNDSTDGSVALVRREFPAAILHVLPENRGPNPARNLGLKQAVSDLVLVMDNDLVLATDYASRLAAVLAAHPGAGVASGQIRIYGEERTVQYNGTDIHFAGEISLRSPDATGVARVGVLSAGAAMFDRRIALNAGAFDEDFVFGWEDGDLTYRLSLLGHPCFIDSGAVAAHIRGQRGLKWVRMQTRNRWWFILKNFDTRTFWLSLPAILLFQLSAGIFFLIHGQFSEYLGGLRDVWNSRATLRAKRWDLQARKVVSDADLLCGDRVSLPGIVAERVTGRVLAAVLDAVFRMHWALIRPLLRRRRSG